MKVGKATILSILSVFAFTLTIIGCDTQITNPLITAAVDELSEPTSTGEVKLSNINPGGEMPQPVTNKLSEPTPVGEMPQPGKDLFDRIPSPITDFFISADQMSVEPSKDPGDFVGRIYAPNPEGLRRPDARPVTGVTVRIMSGTRSGECVTTDKGGFYLFPDIQEDELHLLVEREHFEPKEVIVHRFRPTQPANCAVPNYPGDIQRHPGNILIGQRWPDEVRSMLEEMFLPHDLLYIEGKAPSVESTYGYYGSGVVVTFFRYHGDWREFIPSLLGTLAHEIAHAHQHAVVSVDGSGEILDWVDTPEGMAFVLAREKDWKEVGKTELFDHPFERLYDGRLLTLETAAEMFSYYWNFKEWGWVESLSVGNLKATAPNRFKWAEEWFGR